MWDTNWLSEKTDIVYDIVMNIIHKLRKMGLDRTRPISCLKNETLISAFGININRVLNSEYASSCWSNCPECRR